MDSSRITKELLLSNNYWVLNKNLVHELGIEAAFLLSCFAEAEKMMGDDQGWFYQTVDTLEQHSTLTRHKQEVALDKLKKKKIVEQQNKGMPMKRYFRINYTKLSEILIQASMRKISNQGRGKSATKDVENQQPSMRKISDQVSEKSATNKESNYKESNNKESNNKEQQSCPAKSTLKFGEDSIELNIARKMIEIMLKVKPDSRVPGTTARELQNWCQDIDYTLRLDKRDPMQLIQLFNWSQNNDFWVANIRSPRKLREKWDTLELQMQRDKPKGANNNLNKLQQQYQKAAAEEANEEGGLFG